MSLLKQLASGDVALKFDKFIDSVEDLNRVIKYCFKGENEMAFGWHEFYFAYLNKWDSSNYTSLPSYPLSDFLKELEGMK